MQRYFREWNIPGWPKWLQVGMMTILVIVFFVVGFCFAETLENMNAWSKYQQAKMNARTFRSTMCRIEDIIIEETRPDKNKTVKTTSIKGSFLLRVINSTNKQDEFRVAEIPLLLKSEQHSLVNSSLTCFYDSTGLEQARLTIPSLSKAERVFKFWFFATVITSITPVLIVSDYIIKLFKRIDQFIRSRYQVTAQIAMQPINFP